VFKIQTHYKVAAVLLFVLTLSLFCGGKAHAATIDAATGNDETVVNSNCSLSEAITNINAGDATAYPECTGIGVFGTDDTITIPAGTVTLTSDLPQINIPDGSGVTIAGAGRNDTLVDGSDLYAIFTVSGGTGSDFTISDLSVARNGEDASAAIFISSGNIMDSISISNLRAYNNTLSTARGGIGISSANNISVEQTEIDHNSTGMNQVAAGLMIASNGVGTINLDQLNVHDNASVVGANALPGLLVIDNAGSQQINLLNSTVYNNESDFVGSVELVSQGGEVNVANVTVANNQSAELGGLILYSIGGDWSFSVNNSTISNNIATNSSYGLTAGLVIGATNSNPNLTLTNTLLANNKANGISANCLLSGLGLPFNSGGGNISDDPTCTSVLNQPTDQNNLTPLASTLGPLSDNGGFVPTIPLLENSPAVDAGVNVAGLTTDARLAVRPQGNAFDSGAYESPYSKAVTKNSLASTGQDGSRYTVIALSILTLSSSLLLLKRYYF